MPNKVLTVIMPSNPVEVIRLLVPGQQGPGGVPGPAGPSSVLSMGSVTTGAPGSTASASLSGVSPNQTLNLTIPRGNQGDAGPASNLTIGTITTSLPGSNGAASITGTAPNYVLNLTLPRGYGVPVGGTANQLLVKNSSTDYDTGWTSFDTAATANTIVRRDASGDIYVVDAYGSAAPTAINQLTRKDYVDAGDATKAALVHTHTASQISDSTATGRSVLTAADAAAARSAIGAGTSSLVLGTSNTTAKAGDYQPTAANISDSTATGRSVLTATDGPAARTAIGAGTSSLVLGTTSSTAKAGDYQPASTNISDSTSTGRSLITATDAAAAKTTLSLQNVDNTSDVNKPVSTAQALAISNVRLTGYNFRGNAAYTLQLSDANTVMAVGNTGGINTVIPITLPNTSSVAFPVGTVMDISAIGGTGTLRVTPASGVTLAGDARVYGGGNITIIHIATNYWLVADRSDPAGSFARAFLYADTTVTGWAAGFNYLPLNAESIDSHNGHIGVGAISGSDVDTTTKQNRYTCQPGQAGEYSVSAMINITIGTTATLHCRILKNNAWIRGGAGLITLSSTSGTILTGEKIITLAEGDWVTAQHYSNVANYNTDAGEAANGGATSWMSVVRIS